LDKIKKTLLILFFIVLNSFAIAQSYHQWWYDIHEHDGVTPWQRYLIISPNYFGPNAFPIPMNNQAILSSNIELETAFEGHYNSHEQTHNIFSKLNIPFLKDKISLQIFAVPVEYYSHDTLIRDQRFSRNYEGKGIAYGDIYFSTLIQLVKDHAKWPDILLGIHLKTASGSDFGSARFADVPGYYFDLSMGKSFNLKSQHIQSLRIYSMLGFYVWQTNLPTYFQDDAFLFGFGAQIKSKSISWSNEFAGFYGYINNGDRPFVFRSKFQTLFSGKINYGLQFEHGINDYNFRSIRLSVIYNFKSI